MTKEKFWFLLALLLISMFFSMLPDIADEFMNNEPLIFFIQVVSFVLGFVIDAGLIYVMLRLHDGKDAKLEHLFSQYPITFQYFVATAAYTLMVLAGALFLIVPGIYLGLRYQFFSYFLVDKNASIADSFKESAKITEGQKWQLFRFGLALIGVNILGLLVFVVGLFVTVPLSMLATAYVYRKLSSPIAEEESTEDKEAETFLKTLEDDGIVPERV